MSVKVYGCNHVAIEVEDVEKAIAFYQDVFNLKKLNEGEGDAFFQIGPTSVSRNVLGQIPGDPE
jgi:catechol 2,3-dioxygenase-like lactoylglutathione lyase family enzyme